MCWKRCVWFSLMLCWGRCCVGEDVVFAVESYHHVLAYDTGEMYYGASLVSM